MSKRAADKQITKDDPVGGDDGSNSAGLSPSSNRDSSSPAIPRPTASRDVLAGRKIVTVKRSSVLDGTVSKSVDFSLPKETQPVSLFSGLSGLVKEVEKSTTPIVPSSSGLFSLGKSSTDSSSSIPSLFSSSFSFAPVSFPSFGGSPEKREETPAVGSGSDNEGAEPAEDQEQNVPVVPQPADHGDDEELVFQSDCKLFKLVRESSDKAKWTERGIGFVRLIRKNDKLRVVFRMKGIYKLLVNAALMEGLAKVERVGTKSAKFTIVDEEGKIADFRLNLLMEDRQTEFLRVVEEATGLMAAPSTAPATETI